MKDWRKEHIPWTEDAWNNLVSAEEAYRREMEEKLSKPIRKEPIEELLEEKGMGSAVPKRKE